MGILTASCPAVPPFRRPPSCSRRALFLALSGGAVAGGIQIGKNAVGSGEIKNKSVKGGDLANDTITGSQILESSLGVVPRAASAGSASAATSAATAGTAKYADRAASAGSADRAGAAGTADRATSAERASSAGTADRATSAANADHATSADRLGSRSANDFASSSEVFPVGARLAAGQTRLLVERDGVKIEARCSANVVTVDGGTATALSIYVSSTVDGATFQSPRLDKNGSSPTDSLGPSTPDAERLAVQQTTTTDVPVVRVPAKGIILTSAGGTSIFFGATAGIRIGFGLHGALCSVSAPVVVSTL